MIITISVLVLAVVMYLNVGYIVAIRSGDGNCLPPHLRDKKHTDRVWFKRWMSRNWTSRALVEPPVMIFGSSGHEMSVARNGKSGPNPISRSGGWQFSVAHVKEGSFFYLPYFAITIKRVHFRIGTRWDDIDHYFTLDSLSLKILKREEQQKIAAA
jgi:hypothetical protein